MKLTKIEKMQNLSSKSKNKKIVDEFIEKYQFSTKNAVEHILNMCESLKTLVDIYHIFLIHS